MPLSFNSSLRRNPARERAKPWPIQHGLVCCGLAGMLVACSSESGPERPRLNWITQDTGNSSAVPVVNDQVAPYQPPVMIDVRALEAAMAGTQAPQSAAVLIGSHWTSSDPPPGEPDSIRFLGNMLTVTQRDGRVTTMVADYSGSHERCFGYPLCVVTLNANGTLAVNHLQLRGDTLRFIDCMDFFPEPNPTDEQLAASGATRVWEQGSVTCFAYNSATDYRPDYSTNGPVFRPNRSPADSGFVIAPPADPPQ